MPDYDNIVRLLHELLTNAPSKRPAKQIASLLGKSYSTLFNELNDSNAGHKFGVADLPAFMEFTGSDEPVYFLARLRGIACFKLPPPCPNAEVSLAAIATVKEFGEVMAEYGKSLEGDARLSRDERRSIRKEGYEALEALAAFIESLKDPND